MIFDIITEYMKNQQIIQERTVLQNRGQVILSVDNTNKGSGGWGSSYFKYYFYDKKNKVARIPFDKAVLITSHTNSARTGKGRGDVEVAKTIPSSEIIKLINILKSDAPEQYSRYPYINTVWNALLFEANIESNVSESDIRKYMNSNPAECPRPVIPINAPMPDYTKLK